MKKIIPFIAMAALFSIAIAQDYTKLIHRIDGRSFAIRTTDVDSVEYIASEQVPSEQYNWIDTVYKEIHDTTTIENIVYIHDTIYINNTSSDTYTINGIEYPMPELVDLGITDSNGNTIYWANCNLGALYPYDYGDYFAWGETITYYTGGHSQDNPCSNWKNIENRSITGYNFMSHKYTDHSFDSSYAYLDHIDYIYNQYFTYPYTKYYFGVGFIYDEYGNVIDFYYITDDKFILDEEDDAASAVLGHGWRMPTREDFYNLISQCTCTWTTLNGINGCNIVAKNGNSIFIPAAGQRRRDIIFDTIGSVGYLWAKTGGIDYYDSYVSDYFCVSDKGLKEGKDFGHRIFGRSIRPVYQK